MDDGYFDFQEVTEVPDDLDFSKKRACPHCKKPIPFDATMCFYCGQEAGFSGKKPSWVFFVAIVMIIIFSVLVLIR